MKKLSDSPYSPDDQQNEDCCLEPLTAVIASSQNDEFQRAYKLDFHDETQMNDPSLI